METPKKKRVVDKQLCQSYRTMACAACGNMVGVVGHHIKSRGSGGDDLASNLVPLCMLHHSEIHTIGAQRMLQKHPRLAHHLAK